MPAYLDNSATTRPTEGVIAEVARAMREEYYNPSSAYARALSPEKAINACRDKILGALNARGASVVFTSGGTEANNLALLGALEAMRPGPKRVCVSAVEHPSVLNAVEKLKQMGVEVVYLPVNALGEPDFTALESELRKGLKLISCMQVNNETGAVLDVVRLSAIVRDISPDTRIHVDGVQGFMRERMDFKLVDMYTLSAHKIHGPRGVGALVISKNTRVKPQAHGGGQEGGLRSGTENAPGIIGLSRAIDELSRIPDMAGMLMQKKLMLWRAISERVGEAIANGPAPERGAGHIINIAFPGVGGEVMLHALEEEQVLVSTGSACSSKKRSASAVLKRMGISDERAACAIRFSLSPYTTDDEITCAADAVKRKYELLKRYQRR